MYVQSGMGARRGLGDGTMVNGVYVMTTPITTDTVSSSGVNVTTDSAGNVVIPLQTSGASLTDWLNNNTSLALGLAAAAVAAVLFANRTPR